MKNEFVITLKLLSEAPETQIDKELTKIFKELSKQAYIEAKEILNIMDGCNACKYIVSDFAFMYIDNLWETILIEEGKTRSEGFLERNKK